MFCVGETPEAEGYDPHGGFPGLGFPIVIDPLDPVPLLLLDVDERADQTPFHVSEEFRSLVIEMLLPEVREEV